MWRAAADIARVYPRGGDPAAHAIHQYILAAIPRKAICLAILLIAIFPANIRAARPRFTNRGRTIQAIFVGSLVMVSVLN